MIDEGFHTKLQAATKATKNNSWSGSHRDRCNRSYPDGQVYCTDKSPKQGRVPCAAGH